MNNYLWDRRKPTDPFVEELERRLGPLRDEVDDLVNSLDLDNPEAVILSLPLPNRTRDQDRGWYAAAAVILLAVSVVVLARAQQHRVGEGAVGVEVGGASPVAGRVNLGVHSLARSSAITPHDVIAALRPTHDALAHCALELEPGDRIDTIVALRLDGGVSQVAANAEISPCIRAALTNWDASALGRADVELTLQLQHNQIDDEIEEQD